MLLQVSEQVFSITEFINSLTPAEKVLSGIGLMALCVLGAYFVDDDIGLGRFLAYPLIICGAVLIYLGMGGTPPPI